jgi:hypothetical protein
MLLLLKQHLSGPASGEARQHLEKGFFLRKKRMA